MVNQGRPHRGATSVAKASAAPTIAPDTTIGVLRARTCSAAGPIEGGRESVTANANSALSMKAATVNPTMTRPSGIRIGPRMT